MRLSLARHHPLPYAETKAGTLYARRSGGDKAVSRERRPCRSADPNAMRHAYGEEGTHMEPRPAPTDYLIPAPDVEYLTTVLGEQLAWLRTGRFTV
jgi:hypothetical protein